MVDAATLLGAQEPLTLFGLSHWGNLLRFCVVFPIQKGFEVEPLEKVINSKLVV